MKFKNTTQNNVLVIFLIFIFLVFLQKNNFFRNLYDIHSNNLDKRLVQIYGNCGDQSYGFLNDVRNKYSLVENPSIIDYSLDPNPRWVIYDTSKKNSKKPKIFLNYSKNFSLKFFPRNDIFFNANHIRFTNQINAINFSTNEPIKIDNKLQIYKIINNKKKIIFEKKINILVMSDDQISLNYPTEEINSKWENVYIEIVNLNKNLLQKINYVELTMKNKFQFLDDEVIFKRDNCYFIK
jgi:hypothetical protein